MIINHEQKFIFFHIPRTGGTYIQENLWKYFPNTIKYWGEHVDGTDLSHLYVENIEKYTNINLKLASDYFIFGLVRNPYVRLYSAFLARLRFIRLPKHIIDTNDIKIVFNYFIKNFITSENVMKSNFIWFRPMHTFIYDNDGTQMVTYYKYENYNNILETIKTKLRHDIPFNITKQSVSTGVSLEKFLSICDKDSLKIVNTVYKKDFELFDYYIINN